MNVKTGPYALTAVLAAFFLLACFSASGKGRGFSIGGTAAFQGIGFSAEIPDRSGAAFHSMTLTDDMIFVLVGEASFPGIKGTWHYNIPFKSGVSRYGHRYDFYAGPGITAGYVRNRDNRRGLMSGVTVDAGFRILLDKSTVISLEFQADMALIFKNKDNPNLSLYESGYAFSYLPHLKIMHKF